MNDHPFFSIVIPTYNRAEFIINTLLSVLNQNFGDFEIIVVDDGSTDNSSSLLNEFALNQDKIKLIRQENKERGAARNNGYRNAAGKYVVFFDSDDHMHADHLEILYKNIHENNFPDFIATKFDFVDGNGKHCNSDIHLIKQDYYNYKLFLNGNPLACNVCVKRGLPDLFLFEEDRRYAIKEDWMFLLQNLRNHQLLIIDKITLSMTDHAKRSMRSDNSLIIQRTNLAFAWIIEKITLTAVELNIITAHVNYFCGIHSYLENKRGECINYTIDAIRAGGIKIKYLLLLIKCIIGRTIIQNMK